MDVPAGFTREEKVTQDFSSTFLPNINTCTALLSCIWVDGVLSPLFWFTGMAINNVVSVQFSGRFLPILQYRFDPLSYKYCH